MRLHVFDFDLSRYKTDPLILPRRYYVRNKVACQGSRPPKGQLRNSKRHFLM